MRVFVCLQVLKESTYVWYRLTAPVRSTEPSKLSAVNDAVFEIYSPVMSYNVCQRNFG